MSAKVNYSKLVLEGLAIIVSILFAFGIQAWWDERTEQEDVDRSLTSILIEHRSNIEAVNDAIEHRTLVRNSIMQLFALAASQGPPDPTALDELIGATTWMQIPSVTWGSLDSLLEGGQLAQIESVELRRALVELHRFRSRWERILVDEQGIFDNVLAPYLRKNALLPQLAMTSTAITKPGDEEPSYDFKIPIAQRVDHSHLLKDSEFLGLLVQKLWTQIEATDVNQLFIDHAAEVTGLIEAELDT